MQLIELYETVRPLLLQLGLTRQSIAYRRDNFERADDNQIAEATKWLQSFIDIRVANYKFARARHTDERWAIIEGMGRNGLWEHEELIKAKEQLIVDWRSRPNILKKEHREPEKKNDEDREPRATVKPPKQHHSKSDKKLAGGLDPLPRNAR
jgi:hypothetical protein